MLTKVAPFTSVNIAALEALAQELSEEGLPAGYKMAAEGVPPETCFFLLSSGTFLKRNNEGELHAMHMTLY